MRLLVDTQLLVWAGDNDRRLSRRAIELLDDKTNVALFSALSVAEVAIKHALGRPDFLVDPESFHRRLAREDYDELPLTSEHAVHLRDLPPIHRDPFDRLLVAQAMSEGLTLLTTDAALAGYGAFVRVV